MRVVPLDLAEANAAVRAWHRHHVPAVGHRFSLGLVDGAGVLCGAAIVGRPVARFADQRLTAEVARVSTDGTRNACSMLLGAAARAAKAMGYARIQTFTLPEEGGASLRGAGWVEEILSPGGNWESSSKPNRRQDQPQGAKVRWALVFNDAEVSVVLPETVDGAEQYDLLRGIS